MAVACLGACKMAVMELVILSPPCLLAFLRWSHLIHAHFELSVWLRLTFSLLILLHCRTNAGPQMCTTMSAHWWCFPNSPKGVASRSCLNLGIMSVILFTNCNTALIFTIILEVIYCPVLCLWLTSPELTGHFPEMEPSVTVAPCCVVCQLRMALEFRILVPPFPKFWVPRCVSSHLVSHLCDLAMALSLGRFWGFFSFFPSLSISFSLSFFLSLAGGGRKHLKALKDVSYETYLFQSLMEHLSHEKMS